MPFPILGTPKPQFFDSSGAPLASGTLSVLEPADDTNKASYPTYDDAVALTNALDNPFTLNARGEPANEFWGLDSEDYKLVLKDSAGATIWTIDPVNVPIALPYGITSAETTAGVTPTNYSYEPGNVLRYGATGDGTTDDTTAIQAALDSGHDVLFPFAYSFRLASPGVTVSSNTNIKCEGTIVITSAILAASYVGAIRIDTKTNVHWRGGKIDVSGFATYDNTIIDIRSSTDCTFKDMRIIDGGANRYPLGPFRSQTNVRCKWIDITATGLGDGFMQCIDNDYCTYAFIDMHGGSHTGLDTTTGEHNVIFGCQTNCTSNTTTSAMSFNDKWSTCVGNVSQGGAYGITGGHSGTPIDHSTVIGNVSDSAATNGIQLQYSTNAAVVGNAIDGTATNGIMSDSNCKFNTFTGNTVAGTWTVGLRLGSHSVATGNVVTETALGYRNSTDNVPALYVGNIAANGTGVGFDWGIASSQAENIAVGNLAADDQGTPSQTRGFRSLSAKNLLLGNATDGNHTTSEITGTFTGSNNKDTSVSTAVAFTASDATPSVASSVDFFETADATTYTDFDDARGDGHTFKLLALHAATVTDGANIKTSTGANKTLTVDVVYEFISRNGVWYETATA